MILNFMLTGVHACDYSDASGMLLLDVKNKCWSSEMLDVCSITEKQMPKLFESYEVIGMVKPEIASLLGLPAGVKVVAGAGDNAAAAIGTGTVGAGGCNISLGTSGTIFISSDKFGVDPNNALHAFAHADGGYHLMGCMLSAASCNKWFCEEILKTDDFVVEQEPITEDKLGENHVYFLPYLMGERSPINDTNARGTFMGMTMDTSRADLVQSVIGIFGFAEVGLPYPLTAKYTMNLNGIPTENIARNRESRELTEYAMSCMRQMKLATDRLEDEIF
jgi:xylulokinase